jgi:hypothetical protein
LIAGLNENVEAIMDPARIGSENVIVIGFVRDAWVAPVDGTVETTVGRVRSKMVVPGPKPFSRASHETVRTPRTRSVSERNGADIDMLPKGLDPAIVQGMHPAAGCECGSHPKVRAASSICWLDGHGGELPRQ